MKVFHLTIFIVIFNIFTFGQTVSSAVDISTVYSQSEEFYLKTIPYDNESPTLRGKTSVYRKGSETPLYILERGFDFSEKNNLTLSTNGEVIFYVLDLDANEDVDGLKSISIYKNGKLIKSFTESEITGCDYKKERCRLVFSNFEQVIDEEKSGWKEGKYNRVFKENINEKEMFLFNSPVFNFDDVVYLVDSKKKTHRFDLTEGTYLGSVSFDEIYSQIKDKARENKVERQGIIVDFAYGDFPKLQNGKDTAQSLADFIGMKSASISDEKDEKYKLYRFRINSNIQQDGSVEIEDIEVLDDLPKDKIIEFFKTNKFDRNAIPQIFEKWNLRDEYFYFRKNDTRLARQEKKQEILEQKEALKKRLVAEKIDDIYIPKDLGECFIELDKMLSEVSKNEMKSKKDKSGMIDYHFGLGMWLRNNWGLWSGSRLQKYFTDRKVSHPDDMSGVILEYYYDWLQGKSETWKDWEKKVKK